MEAHRVVRRQGSHIFLTIGSQMAVRLSDLSAGRPLPPQEDSWCSYLLLLLGLFHQHDKLPPSLCASAQTNCTLWHLRCTMYVRSVRKYRITWRSGNTPDSFGGFSVRISDGIPAFLVRRFRGFPQSLEKYARTVSRLRHDGFLPNPYSSTILSINGTSPVTDSVAK
jgi:hypothetical protein